VYRVGGQRFRDEQSCGIVEWQDVCPAVGTRRYVRFSPEDPHTDQLTAVPVPDSLEHVPPLGWEQIP
jgi:rRNA maturation protein Nop10